MRILIVDDQAAFAGVLRRVVAAGGYPDVETAASGEEALERMRGTPVDVLITDLRLGGMDGLTLLAEARRRVPGLDVILMTAFAGVDTAKQALKRGALDYLVKPFDNAELLDLLRQAVARRSARDDGAGESFLGIVGRSDAIRRVVEQVRRAAATDAAVLILGASGTGKELVARAIHTLGARHGAPFMAIHAPAIPVTLLESELFGHEKGAFTGADAKRLGQLEVAEGGTVFLDEIADLPVELQPKLLRFLQERQFMRVGGRETITVDVRVMAATNRSLEEEIRAGRFREDLFYRLDVIRIEIPPLRDRVEDIEPLLQYEFRKRGRSDMTLAPEALQRLRDYPWPGNVRELQNVVERTLLDVQGRVIGADMLPESIRNPTPQSVPGTVDLAENEARMIREALRRAGGNKAGAARLLGISRRRLYSRMERLGLPIEDAQGPLS